MDLRDCLASHKFSLGATLGLIALVESGLQPGAVLFFVHHLPGVHELPGSFTGGGGAGGRFQRHADGLPRAAKLHRQGVDPRELAYGDEGGALGEDPLAGRRTPRPTWAPPGERGQLASGVFARGDDEGGGRRADGGVMGATLVI